MKIFPHCLFALCAFSTALAESRFYAEAGASYAALSGANYTSSVAPAFANGSVVAGSPTPTSTFTLQREDKSSWSPYIATGYNFTDRFALELSYRYLSEVSASARVFQIVGGDAVVGNEQYSFNDKVHLLSLSPQFKWPVTDKFSLRIAPELNWVANRGEILISASNPAANVIPRLSHNEEEFTFGASAGIFWKLTDKCDLLVGYKYANLKPSWSRTAHLITSALHWEF